MPTPPQTAYNLVGGFNKRLGAAWEDIRPSVASWSDMTVVDERPHGFGDAIAVYLHHMGTPRQTDDEKAIIRVITRYHRAKGWGTCGYHICIGQHKAWLTTPLKLMSHHTYGHNREGIGICILDDLTEQGPTKEQLELLRKTLWVLWEFLGGNWGQFRFTHIISHNHVVPATDCPAKLKRAFTWGAAWGLDEVVHG